ncbi:MAG: DUF368 domain-containing protein [Clostridia bacterium]|nr:DUF368 domain-containing protein [Clostridia bacterium]
MALANSVPGISGGTVAFIFGFYDKFINSLHDLVGKDNQKRKEAIVYLLKFAIGFGIGLVACILLLANLFESHVHVLSSFFLGLTAVAVPIIAWEEKDCLKGKYFNLLFSLLGVAIVVGLTFGRSALNGFSAIDFKALEFWQYFYVFIVGMVAISAMVLPGISGSTVLLIAGVYLPVLNAVKTFFSFDFSVFLGLFVFGMGIIIGAVLSVTFISRALQKYRSATVYFILGLMLGSFVAIVAGPTTLTPPQAALNLSNFSWQGFALGVGLLLALEGLKYFQGRKKQQKM